jgi:uncharacterized protein YcfL
MKKLLSIGLVLVLITGCGASPQEKRNNYDACLIEEDRRNYKPVQAASSQLMQELDDGS